MMWKYISTLVFCVAFGAFSESTKPCCKTCEPGKAKFFSIPDPSAKDPQCGECCLEPGRYKFWKLFEPKLLKGDCASQGFSKYLSTETDGVWPLAVSNDRYARTQNFTSAFCPGELSVIFADVHDGDQKQVKISGSSMIITPYGNNQTWVVHSKVDPISCSAVIDFNVSGKPNPPPVSLTATLWYAYSEGRGKKIEFEFTDPSRTLPEGPLNRWIQINKETTAATVPGMCEASFKGVFADMHDGDEKEVTISGSQLTIKPSGNNQSWIVRSNVDASTCSAIIDFIVPGKPGPPPVSLTMALWYTVSTKEKKLELEFTDPSGTLAATDFPLNLWVELSRTNAAPEIMI